METTKKQLIEIKKILDGAYWTGVCGHPDRISADCEKAYSYLNHQKWSLRIIESAVNDLDVVDVYENANHNVDIVPEVAAKMIANQLAESRICKYRYRSDRKPGNGWHIPESHIFEIITAF